MNKDLDIRGRSAVDFLEYQLGLVTELIEAQADSSP
jgi:hypothetical protein